MADVTTASEVEQLAEKLDQHVKTNDTRKENWKVFGFETQLDPRYGRAQYRYIGTSGNVDHTDPTALMGEHFTLTIIRQPPGHIQPIHVHPEEEVFFVLEGSPTIVWETKDGEQVTRKLNKWDMVYNPPGIFHGARNDGDVDALYQIMLGNPKPNRPVYKDPELRALQQEDNSDEENRQ